MFLFFNYFLVEGRCIFVDYLNIKEMSRLYQHACCRTLKYDIMLIMYKHLDWRHNTIECEELKRIITLRHLGQTEILKALLI